MALESHHHELGATVLLAVAAVATAWSSYQAARWNGQQSQSYSRANALRLESTRSSNRANTQILVDVTTFSQWVDAYARNESRLTAFYFERFRPEFKPAVEAWIATRPLKNPKAPLTPFAMPQYRLAANVEADRLDAAAERASEQAKENNQRADNYVLGVVLFATALFFAGISTKLPALRNRWGLLALGWAICAGTLIWIATFPVSFSLH